MDTSKIGIKIADGTFYPVLEEGTAVRKRLVVTTVKDNQRQVQIDVYRGTGDTLEGARYIGSLIIEDIAPSPKGEAEVEVLLGIDDEGNLNAVASDSSTGNRQSLSTSLESYSDEAQYTIPEFELDEELETEAFSAEDDDTDLTGTTYPIEPGDRRRTHLEKGKSPVLRLVFIFLGLLIIAGITYIVFLLISQTRGSRVPQIGNRLQVPPAGATARPGDAVTTAGAQANDQQPAAAPAVDASAGKRTPVDGLWYTIKWGDTLWDISSTYYRDPWRYGRIADHPQNRINDPDYILAGFKLYIPRN